MNPTTTLPPADPQETTAEPVPTSRPGRLPPEQRPARWGRLVVPTAEPEPELEPPAPLRSDDGRVVLDPRLRARRVAVRRGAGRRRLHRVVAVAGALGVVVCAVVAVRSPLLAVRHLGVAASPHLDRAALLGAADLRDGMPMVDVDEAAAQRRLRALPWVATARVTRDWPGTVTLSVTERTPVAQVRVGSGWMLLDGTGRVLAQQAAPIDVVVLEGIPATAAGTVARGSTDLIATASALPQRLRARVRSVARGTASTGVVLHLVGAGEIHLGGVNQLRDKIVAAVTMLDNVDASCLGIVDVQVPNAPTLTPAQGCA